MRAGWQQTTLGRVCEISSALVDPREPGYRTLPHVGGANIESMTGVLTGVQTAEAEGLTSGKFVFGPGTVLYSKIRPYLQKVARPDFRGLCSADIYPLTPDASRISRDYLYYLLLSEDFTEFAEAGSARAGMPKVNRDHLFAYPFALPPLPEQRRVVGILDQVFEGTAIAKANAERNVSNARALLDAYLATAFAAQGGRWPTKPLGDLCEILDSRRKPVTKRDRVPGDVPYYGATGVQDFVRDFIFDEPLVLVGEDGARWGPGEATAFAIAGRSWVNNHAHVLRPRRDLIIDDWLIFYLRWADLGDFIAGATVQKLTQASLRSIPVPVPSLSVQARLVASARQVAAGTRRISAVCEGRRTQLDALKQSLLSKAFTGQL